ncbi:MAG: membrane protein insertase YidC [Parcubacteria group bacterium]|nr:membrane protein insertase YidC [Parcubacteria group bacterium]
MNIFHEFLYRPLFNLLVFLYNIIPGQDIGWAIIATTLAIKLVFWPMTKKAIKSQRALQEIQPQLKALQEKYKDNKEEQAKQLMNFYKENKVNPFSGCLPLIVQLPILIALYQVFLKGFDPKNLSILYSFVANPGAIDPVFLGFLNLALPNKVMAVLAGLSQFWQAKMITPKNKLPAAPKSSDEFMAQAISKQTLYFLPVLTVIISWKLPAGLALYWLVTTLFTVIQQYAIIRSAPQKQ